MGCSEGEERLGNAGLLPVMAMISLTSSCFHEDISRDRKLTTLVGRIAPAVRNCLLLLCLLPHHLYLLFFTLLSRDTLRLFSLWHDHPPTGEVCLSRSPFLQEKSITSSDSREERVSRSLRTSSSSREWIAELPYSW